MATDLYTKVVYKFHAKDGGSGTFEVRPDIPDDCKGFSVTYESGSRAIVKFKETLTAEELAACEKHGAVKTTETAPEFSDDMKSKETADTLASKVTK